MIRSRFHSLALFTVCVVLAGCGEQTQTTTDQDIKRAQADGTLENLYRQIEINVNTTRGKSKVEKHQALLTKVGSLLATDSVDAINKQLNSSQLASGRYPLILLTKSLKTTQKIIVWDKSKAELLRKKLKRELSATQDSIRNKKQQLQNLTPNDFNRRLILREQIAKLDGSQLASNKLIEERDIQLNQQFQIGQDQLNVGQFEHALKTFQRIGMLAPNYEGLDKLLNEAEIGLSELRFRSALENGAPDMAFELLEQYSASPVAKLIHKRIAGSAGLLVDYYNGVAASATRSHNYKQAFRHFISARKVTEILGGSPGAGSPAEDAYIEQLYDLSVTAAAQNLPGVELGYFLAIDYLRPQFPSLERLSREPRNKVKERAVKRISSTGFKDSSEHRQFGDQVAAKVTQILFKAIPDDIRIVERDQLSAILRERSIDEEKEYIATDAAIIAADYIIQGSIFEAGVDSSLKEGKKTERVVTSHIESINPSWTQWAEKRRNKKPEPTKILRTPVNEDISYAVTQHKKIGIMSASYRIIDASSAKVRHTNTLSVKDEFTGESSEGVSLGEFSLPLKLADMPSDIEILNALMEKLSIKIGNELISLLNNIENDYFENANYAAKDGNFALAASRMANAFVIAEMKGLATEKYADKLREYALSSGL